MIAYKLVRKMRDGSLAPLFINKKQRIPVGEWLEAENQITLMRSLDLALAIKREQERPLP